MDTLRVSHTGGPGCWRGRVMFGKRAIWTCPHVHGNRDQTTYTGGLSARSCASMVVALLTDPEYAARMRKWAAMTNHDPRATLAQLAELEPVAAALKATWLSSEHLSTV